MLERSLHQHAEKRSRAIYRQEGVAARLCFERIQNIAPSIENSSNTDHTLMVHKAHCALARLEDDYEYALRIRSEWEKLSISKGIDIKHLTFQCCAKSCTRKTA